MRKILLLTAIAGLFSLNAHAAQMLTNDAKTDASQKILSDLGVLEAKSKEIIQKLKNRPKSLVQDYEETGKATISTKNDGTVVYPYGEASALLVCAPLRVCTVQLNADEKVLDAAAGDTVRWKITPAKSGKRDVAIIKPQSDSLATNLVITTDKRIYNIELRSSKVDSMTSLAFWYPEDELLQKWGKEESVEKVRKHDEAVTVANVAGKLNFDYEVEGKSRSFLVPVRVYDDGQQVIIQMQDEVSKREAPALFVLDAAGSKKLVNYRVKGGNYIVDKLFDRAVMIVGHDDEQEEVKITRKGYSAPESISADYSKGDNRSRSSSENWWQQ
jgi:type IV secretion system protein VirB9